MAFWPALFFNLKMLATFIFLQIVTNLISAPKPLAVNIVTVILNYLFLVRHGDSKFDVVS